MILACTLGWHMLPAVPVMRTSLIAANSEAERPGSNGDGGMAILPALERLGMKLPIMIMIPLG